VKLKGPIPLADLLDLCPNLSEDLKSGVPHDVVVNSIDSIENATENSLTFIRKNVSAKIQNNLNCAFAFSEAESVVLAFPSLQVENIFPLINQMLEFCTRQFSTWSSDRIVDAYPLSANIKGKVDRECQIGAGCTVGNGSVILKGCVLEPQVTVMENCFIDENVTLQSGTVLGPAGFGFYSYDGEKIPIRHAAGVHIERDVWIGANTVIAAGVMNPTFIGVSSKIDSHVQIAHNVSLGHHSIIASQSGIAGSTIIGHHLIMGGASSIAGHLTIGHHVKVAARTGVTKNIKDYQVIAGFPAQPINKWKRQQIHLRKL